MKRTTQFQVQEYKGFSSFVGSSLCRGVCSAGGWGRSGCVSFQTSHLSSVLLRSLILPTPLFPSRLTTSFRSRWISFCFSLIKDENSLLGRLNSRSSRGKGITSSLSSTAARSYIVRSFAQISSPVPCFSSSRVFAKASTTTAMLKCLFIPAGLWRDKIWKRASSEEVDHGKEGPASILPPSASRWSLVVCHSN